MLLRGLMERLPLSEKDSKGMPNLHGDYMFLINQKYVLLMLKTLNNRYWCYLSNHSPDSTHKGIKTVHRLKNMLARFICFHTLKEVIWMPSNK